MFASSPISLFEHAAVVPTWLRPREARKRHPLKLERPRLVTALLTPKIRVIIHSSLPSARITSMKIIFK